MKINWVRVMLAGLVSEMLFMLVYQIYIWRFGTNQATIYYVAIGAVIVLLLGALWAGRKIESRFILHGFLVGVFAIIYYVIVSFPNVLNGTFPMNYWMAALIGHPPKLVGGLLGGYIAGRIAKAKSISAPEPVKTATRS